MVPPLLAPAASAPIRASIVEGRPGRPGWHFGGNGRRRRSKCTRVAGGPTVPEQPAFAGARHAPGGGECGRARAARPRLRYGYVLESHFARL